MSLKDKIKQDILSHGPMPVSQYMERCLYDPEHGYYMTRNPVGRSGDFVTAPELTSLFGETLAVCLLTLADEMGYEDKTIDVVELGGGPGVLMSDMMRAMEILGRENRYHMVELSPALQKVQQETLQGKSVTWYNSLVELLEEKKDQPLFVVANEFLDAMPFEQFIYQKDGWHQRMVDVADDKLTWFSLPIEIEFPEHPKPKVGDVAEASPMANMMLEMLGNHIQANGGAMVFVDYGYSDPKYGDTFQAMKGHKYVDPFEAPGEADLTAHVNFYALQNILAGVGFERMEVMTQADFLDMFAIKERMESLLGTMEDEVEQENLKAACDRLLNPKEMGTLFKVLVALD